jgi:hypothetical protein
MSDDQILIEVARLDGIELVENSTMGGWRWVASNCRSEWYASKEDALKNPPDDYLNSRDAIIPVIEKQVEKSFSFKGKFNCELSKEACNRNLSSAVKEADFIFQMITPNARQLSVALLKSVGKFRE